MAEDNLYVEGNGDAQALEMYRMAPMFCSDYSDPAAQMCRCHPRTGARAEKMRTEVMNHIGAHGSRTLDGMVDFIRSGGLGRTEDGQEIERLLRAMHGDGLVRTYLRQEKAFGFLYTFAVAVPEEIYAALADTYRLPTFHGNLDIERLAAETEEIKIRNGQSG
ncbi:MAG: hypothetical protein ABIH41_07565 [Nanoarchaeota archaeon]